MKIFRIQDKTGRGPWKPGFSHKWLDEEGPPLPPAIYETVRNFQGIVTRANAKGMYLGCAVREGKLSEWISESEMARLKCYGYFLVNAGQCQILADDGMQVIIASKKPLRNLPRVSA